MNDIRKSIDHLIDEWFRMRCHEKYNNVPRGGMFRYLKELFELLKENSYSYEDLTILHIKKIKKLCQWQEGANPHPKAKVKWLGEIEANWNNASALIFPSTDAPLKEEVAQAEIESPPISPNLLKTDVVYDKDDMSIIEELGILKEFCE